MSLRVHLASGIAQSRVKLSYPEASSEHGGHERARPASGDRFVTLLVMVSPGPDMVLVLRNTFVGGRRAGLQTSIGISREYGPHRLLRARHRAAHLAKHPGLFALGPSAAAYLIYLGIMTFALAPRLSTRGIDRRPPRTPWFVQGFVNNLLNPKGTLFYLACLRRSLPPARQ